MQTTSHQGPWQNINSQTNSSLGMSPFSQNKCVQMKFHQYTLHVPKTAHINKPHQSFLSSPHPQFIQNITGAIPDARIVRICHWPCANGNATIYTWLYQTHTRAPSLCMYVERKVVKLPSFIRMAFGPIPYINIYIRSRHMLTTSQMALPIPSTC